MGKASLRKKQYVRLFRTSSCHGSPDIKIVEDYPEGYPQVTAFIESDTAKFLMARKFGYLRTRQLLDLQTDLAQYEQALLGREKRDSVTCPLAMRSRNEDAMREECLRQSTCLQKIGRKLKEYG